MRMIQDNSPRRVADGGLNGLRDRELRVRGRIRARMIAIAIIHCVP